MNTSSERIPVERFIALYQALQPGSVSRSQLSEIYADQIEFSDPVHNVTGLDELTRYFDGLYQNIAEIHFDFHRTMTRDSETIAHWTMTYRHPSLGRGRKVIRVEGASILTWDDGRIIRHQDIFDAGALLYEHLPILGWVIRKLKERMQ